MKTRQLVLAAILSVPFLGQAAPITFPAVDIQNFTGDGLTGALLTSGTSTTLEIEAIAFDIIQYAGENATDDIIPNQIFTLSATSSDFDGNDGIFSGAFSISGGLLAGTFDTLNVSVTTAELFSGFFIHSGAFDGLLTYTGGSLQGSLLTGTLNGSWNGNAALAGGADIAAKLGEVAVVPVPAAAWLFASGLLGLVGVARRRAN